ncbi:MAG: imidazole glycerol phosphate synthase subunit HisF, partial [Candidatus Bathyarchaeota archaeon]
MLTKRIIPCLDMKDGRVVKGTSFKNLQDAGDPAELAAFYDEQGADEIVLLDISASHERRQTLIEVVRQTSEKLFIPLMVGGGIRTVQDIRSILLNGADKIAINTAAIMEPELLHEASATFGSQCIVASIDVKRVYVQNEEETPNKIVVNTPAGKCWWDVYIYGGRKSVGIDAIKWAKMVAALGAGEIMASSLDFDGKQQGYDLDFLRIVSERTRIPLIASSGAGNPQHMLDALQIGKA